MSAQKLFAVRGPDEGGDGRVECEGVNGLGGDGGWGGGVVDAPNADLAVGEHGACCK